MNKREIEIARLAYQAGVCGERDSTHNESSKVMANEWVDDANMHGGWHYFEEMITYPDAGPFKGLTYTILLSIVVFSLVYCLIL